MTTIEKLSIQGIRSFNPREPTTIDFYKPLTIIVGHNGLEIPFSFSFG